MKVVILAGGFGTRLGELTEAVPKPMLNIGGKPIIWHIMNTFAKYNHKEFFLALGYKGEHVKDYFLNYKTLNSNFTIDLSNNQIKIHQNDLVDWKITLVDTGINSMTGGRLKRMANFINDKTFILTYGDGVSDININDLIAFHKSHGKLVTVSAVHPAARFGELTIENNQVKNFIEKPQMSGGWINGGYFVIEPNFLDYIDSDTTVLESEPLERLAKDGELMAYFHKGFWQCMDTKRDKDLLEQLWIENRAPWKP